MENVGNSNNGLEKGNKKCNAHPALLFMLSTPVIDDGCNYD